MLKGKRPVRPSRNIVKSQPLTETSGSVVTAERKAVRRPQGVRPGMSPVKKGKRRTLTKGMRQAFKSLNYIE